MTRSIYALPKSIKAQAMDTAYSKYQWGEDSRDDDDVPVGWMAEVAKQGSRPYPKKLKGCGCGLTYVEDGKIKSHMGDHSKWCENADT